MEGKKHKGVAYPPTAHILSNYSHDNLISIEIGCGSKPYKPFIKGIYYGTDIRSDIYAGEAADIFCSGEALPFRGSSVDLVFTVATLYQIPNCWKVFKEARRALKPGGKFLVFDYNWHIARRLEKAEHGHRHKFTPLFLWYLCVKNGFKPKWIFYLPRPETRLGQAPRG
ncbi:MAG: class I SAM-dependent methyltransferase [Deltaproteobacteria bacterium]|nr:class I SAM-dependent methyltransferase [Deltaproteobacteria bacterium]